MAEQERQTKRERRAQAREERKRKEAEAAKQQRRQQATTLLVGVLVVAAIGAIVYTAFFAGTESIEGAVLVSAEAADEAEATAGCEVVDDSALPSREHFDPQSAPPADALYGQVRPTHSGPHFNLVHPPSTGSDTPLDERATTHNLEHGAVIVYHEPGVPGDVQEAIEAWAERLNASGFQQGTGGSFTGAAILTSPYPEISGGHPIAFRAWGIAVGCDEWNETFANSFVIDNYGTHGQAPEAAALGRYPEGVLAYGNPETGDTQAPTPQDTGATGSTTPEDSGATDSATPEDTPSPEG